MWDEIDLVGQATEDFVVVVAFVVVWVVEDKSFELKKFEQQGDKSSPAKVFEEARAARALEYSTSNFEHKEIEKAIVTYLQDVAAMVFEGPLHKVH